MIRSTTYSFDAHIQLFHPPRIKRLRKDTQATNKKAARVFAESWIEKVRREDREGITSQMMLWSGLHTYVSDYSSVKNRHWQDHKLCLRRIRGEINGLPPLKDTLISQLQPSAISKLVASRLRAGLAASTVNKEVMFLSGALKWLNINYKVALPEIEWSSFTQQTFKKKRWATPSQLQDILQHIKSPDQRDAFVLLITTGARLSEIITLRWDQVGADGLIHLERTKTGTEGAIGLTDAAQEILRRRWETRTSTFVFQSSRKSYPSPMSRPRQIDDAIKASSLNDDLDLVARNGKFTIHSLRDSFASILAQSGGHCLGEIQELLGHSSPVMTKKYAHLIPSEVARKAAVTLDSALDTKGLEIVTQTEHTVAA